MWKNWPNWLKGGIIAVSINLILMIIAIIYALIANASRDAIIYLIGLVQIPSFIAVWYASYTNTDSLFEGIIALMLGLTGYFLEGVIIGWLIGKIKSKIKSERCNPK